MKKLLVLILAAVSIPAFAYNQKQVDFCKKIHSFSENVMKLRQFGYPEGKVISALGNGQAQMLKFIIVQAYNEPRHTNPLSQVHAVRNFADKMSNVCYSTLK